MFEGITPDPKPAKKKKKRPGLPKPLVVELFETQGYQCQYCGRIFPPGGKGPLDCPLHPHHVKHKSQGGKDTLKNLNTVCWECHGNHGKITKIDKEKNNGN